MCGAALPFCPTDAFPIRGYTAPPIRAVIPVRFTARCDPIRGRFLARQCGESGTVWGGFVVLPKVVSRVRFFRRAAHGV